MTGESGLNGDSERLWDLLKRELDLNRESINRVENRLLEKFDALDKRLDDRDKRLDVVETTVQAHSKLIWIIVSAVIIAAAGVIINSIHIWG